MGAPLRLKRLVIKNARCFKDAELDFMTTPRKSRNMTLLVGDNGEGKTTILKAIAIGLSPEKEAAALITDMPGRFIRRNKKGAYEKRAEICLELFDPAKPSMQYRITTILEEDQSGQEFLRKTMEPADFPWERIFVCGYGVNRGGRASGSLDTYRIREAVNTLFDDGGTLLEPETVLKNFKLAQLEAENGTGGKVSFNDLIRHLKFVLRLAPSHKIEVSAERVLVHGKWGAMPFHALGDGYRGTSSWLLDFVSRSHAAGHPMAGIVLLDELDEHLHPSWQRKLPGLLKSRFKHIQFVATTHSALPLVDCSANEIIACHLHNAVASLVSDMPGPQGKSADDILRGEWFGLDATVDSKSAKLLSRYRTALAKNASAEDIASLRKKVHQQLGYQVFSPMDELAIQIAAEVRKDFNKHTTEIEKSELLTKAAQRLRERLRGAS